RLKRSMDEHRMIVLFTDFGRDDPYVGQLHAVLARDAPNISVIDLFHAVPNFDIRAGAYLLPAYTADFPAGTVFVCVVDPGVGGARVPVAVCADGRWYIGPDNGLFSVLARRAEHVESYAIRWRPPALSASFHGRDLFAPVAARVARGEPPEWDAVSLTTPAWPEDLAQIVYIDHYGNAITGLRAEAVPPGRRLRVGKRTYAYARVFAEAVRGRGFWYVNANGLVELAVREDSAARRLGLRVGMSVRIIK
ncbi:MAG TPA: SAM-dependent chlorinase/fluorinase, partial [Burkholderiales bacterium]|nr:SAM-dependent chlorinase/fluorinase [Burkholderiales bacterium]